MAMEETPHELVLEPGGIPREEALNLAAKQFPLVKRGQHVYFTVPADRGVEPVYAFARSKGLKVLDIDVSNRASGALMTVKCVDTP